MSQTDLNWIKLIQKCISFIHSINHQRIPIFYWNKRNGEKWSQALHDLTIDLSKNVFFLYESDSIVSTQFYRIFFHLKFIQKKFPVLKLLKSIIFIDKIGVNLFCLNWNTKILNIYNQKWHHNYHQHCHQPH